MSGAEEGAARAGAARLECPAYSLPVKVLATTLVAGIAAVAWHAAGAVMAATWSMHEKAGLAVMLGALLLGWGWILSSRTSIDATHIRQAWLWSRQVRRADITQARLVHLPGLSWIVAPRLVVRLRGQLRAVVFPAAGREVLAEFARLGGGPTRLRG